MQRTSAPLHTTKGQARPERPFQLTYYPATTRAILSLCSTNKRLNSAITPRLYEQVTVTTDNLRLLLHTVLAKPSLASLVRHTTFEWDEYYEDWENYDRMPASDCILPPPDLAALFVSAATTLSRPWTDGAALEKLRLGSADAEGTLLLQHLTSLRSMRLDFRGSDPDVTKGPGWDYSTGPDGGIFLHPILLEALNTMALESRPTADTAENVGVSRPVSLAALESFEMSSPFEEPFSWTMYIPIVQFWDPSVLMRQLLFLPGLRVLRLERLSSSSGSKSVADSFSMAPQAAWEGCSRLEEIHLKDSIIDATELCDLMKLPKALKVLVYELPDVIWVWEDDMMEPDAVSPTLLIQALLPQKPSLQHLTLSSINLDQCWDAHPDNDSAGFERTARRSPPSPPADKSALAAKWREIKSRLIGSPIDLSPFTALKSVEVHVTDLLGPMLDGSSWSPGSNSSTPLHSAALASRLPFAIEVLKLRLTLYFDDHRPQGLDSRNLGVYDKEWSEEESAAGDSSTGDWPAEDWYQGYYGGIVSALVEGKKSSRVGRLDTLVLKRAEEWPEIGEGATEVASAVGIEVIKVMDRFVKGAVFG